MAHDRHAGPRRLELHPCARGRRATARSGSPARRAGSCGCEGTRRAWCPGARPSPSSATAQGLPAPASRRDRGERRDDLGGDGRGRRAARGRALPGAGRRARGQAPVGDLRDRGRPGHKRIAAGGESGLFLLEGTRWSRRSTSARAFVGSVNSLLQTKDAAGLRTLWVGTYGSGVVRIRQGRVDRFGPAEGLASRLVTSLALTRRGPGGEQLWAGTRDAGIFRAERRALQAGSARPVDLGGVLAARRRRGGPRGALGRNANGRAAAARAGSWLTLDRSSGLPADQVLGLLETTDPAGQPVYWVGTADGLAVIRGGHLSVEGAAQGLPGRRCSRSPSCASADALPRCGRRSSGLGLVKRVGERWVRVDTRPAFTADHGAWLLPRRRRETARPSAVPTRSTGSPAASFVSSSPSTWSPAGRTGGRGSAAAQLRAAAGRPPAADPGAPGSLSPPPSSASTSAMDGPRGRSEALAGRGGRGRRRACPPRAARLPARAG